MENAPSSAKLTRLALAVCASLAFAVPAALWAAEVPTEPRLVVDTGFHTTMIRRVSVSADGGPILAASEDKTARLFDGSGHLIRIFRVPPIAGGEGQLKACVLSPDGRIAALGGYTGRDFEGKCCVYLFDTTSGSQVFADKDYGSDSYAVVFSEDESLLAASSFDGSIWLYRKSGSGSSYLLAVGFYDAPAVEVYSVSAFGLSAYCVPDLKGISGGDLSSVALTPSPTGGLRLIAGGMYNSCHQFPLLVWEDAGKGNRRSLEIGAMNTIMDIQSKKSGGLVVGAFDPFLARLDDNIRFLQGQRSDHAIPEVILLASMCIS